jgi:subfamily B ATP-binding cassette protein MsbA
MDETLTGMRIIRAFNATGFTLKKFSRENDFYRNASLQGFKRREMAPAFSEAAGVLVVAGILLYGGSLILKTAKPLPAYKPVSSLPLSPFFHRYYGRQKPW